MTSPIQLASVASLPHSQQAQTNAISNPWPQGSASTHQNSQNFLAQPFQPYVAPVSSVTASATLLEQADKEPWR